MSNERIGLYEGMFLFPQSATSNLQDAVDHIKDILSKCNASVITLRKWDDRRLAYEISKSKRGVYFLVFFNAPALNISEIERRCNQSERLLRVMITKADHLPSELIEANDGTEDLATEITLRSKKAAETGSSTGSTISRKAEEAASKEQKPKEKPAKVKVEEEAVKQQAPKAEESKEVAEEVSEA